MGKLTAFLGLFIPEKTDRGKVVTEVFEPNFQKLDDNAKEVDTTLKEIDKEIENIKKTEITSTGALTSNGNLGENITIEHKTGAGYNHIPAGGVIGQVLKNNGDGSAEWGDLSLDNYYNKGEIDSKFKKYCPVRVGDILLTSSTENPAETYLGTTWELLPDNKFLKTGSTPLQTGGSNSINIAKENLPAEKLQIDSFSLTRGTMEITGTLNATVGGNIGVSGAFINKGQSGAVGPGYYATSDIQMQASKSWTGNTSSATPYTNVMGNGTPITINPEHITIKAWKRTK